MVKNCFNVEKCWYGLEIKKIIKNFKKMKNNFIENINDEKYFYSLIEDLENSKVGFYSVGLYPASLAYNCAMHGKSNNILLAPREDRDLLGAFSNEVLSDMDNATIEKIKRMGHYSSEGIRKSFDLKDLLLQLKEYYVTFHAWHSCMLKMQDINQHCRIQLCCSPYL